MAEIHVQTKKGSSNQLWLWVVLAVIIIGVAVYYLMNRNNAATTTKSPADTTRAVRSLEHLNIATSQQYWLV